VSPSETISRYTLYYGIIKKLEYSNGKYGNIKIFPEESISDFVK
jgi:hypothetical protein